MILLMKITSLMQDLVLQLKLDKKPSKFGNFIGYDSVKAKKAAGYEMRVMQFLLSNPESMLYHNEPISKKW